MRQVIFQFAEDTEAADEERIIEWLNDRAVNNVRRLFDTLDDPELSRIVIADIEDEERGEEVLEWLNADSAIAYAEEEPKRKLAESTDTLAVPFERKILGGEEPRPV
jgi:hypothetical protein